jgi:hypothetical protein
MQQNILYKLYVTSIIFMSFRKLISHPCFDKALVAFAVGSFIGTAHGENNIKKNVLKATKDRDPVIMAAIEANYRCTNPWENAQAREYEWR